MRFYDFLLIVVTQNCLYKGTAILLRDWKANSVMVLYWVPTQNIGTCGELTMSLPGGAYSLTGKPDLLNIWNNKRIVRKRNSNSSTPWPVLRDFVNEWLRFRGEFIWDTFLMVVQFPLFFFFSLQLCKWKILNTEKFKE